MTLNSSRFTRKNIEYSLLNGKEIGSFPSHTEPYFVIKVVGPPGAGKSSNETKILLEANGIDPSSAIHIDIDKVNASFKSFRNRTRNVRRNYNSKPFNLSMYSTLSGIHTEHQYMKNRNKKTVKQDISSVISQSIKQHKNIITETVKPINHTINQFGNLLSKHKYRIIVLFYRVPESVLRVRILNRGERLYRDHSYYRAFPLNTLTTVINDLETNLREYIIPLYDLNIIHKIIYIE